MLDEAAGVNVAGLEVRFADFSPQDLVTLNALLDRLRAPAP
ncbi:hypothetical protein [Pseudonocardia xinjiangensis]|nr:hypothetical protein [Pseudonocardia xinjiangensis]